MRPQSKNVAIILGIISLSLLWAFYSEVEPGRGGGGAAGCATGSSRLRRWRWSQGIEVKAQLEVELGCVGRGAAGSGAGVSSFWHWRLRCPLHQTFGPTIFRPFQWGAKQKPNFFSGQTLFCNHVFCINRYIKKGPFNID